jgi:hypothetical protein
MNIELAKENIKTMMDNNDSNHSLEVAVYNKEKEMLYMFLEIIEDLEKSFKKQEEEFEELTDSYEYLDEQLYKLAAHISDDIPLDPHDYGSVVDTAIRLLPEKGKSS